MISGFSKTKRTLVDRRLKERWRCGADFHRKERNSFRFKFGPEGKAL
jgi:hypothetical protein